MTRSSPPATLLVFTLGPQAERRRRPLLPRGCAPQEIALRRRCLESAVEAGRASGCRVEICAPTELPAAGVPVRRQDGRDFGQRLANAVAATEERAHGPVVVVGTDVPGLSTCHVTAALAHLRSDPEAVVVGPSPDGGLYLLASAAPVAELLRRVRWCRRDTLLSLYDELEAAGRTVHRLPRLGDLDRRADLESWLAEHRAHPSDWHRLVGRLQALLAELLRPLGPPRLGVPRPAHVPVCPGRAPPPAGRLPLR